MARISFLIHILYSSSGRVTLEHWLPELSRKLAYLDVLPKQQHLLCKVWEYFPDVPSDEMIQQLSTLLTALILPYNMTTLSFDSAIYCSRRPSVDVLLLVTFLERATRVEMSLEKTHLCYLTLAVCYHIQNQIEEADLAFQNGIACRPTMESYAEYAHFLYQQKKYMLALKQLSLSFQCDTNSNLSYGKLEYPTCEVAIQLILDQHGREANVVFPAESLAYYFQSRCYEQLGDDSNRQVALQQLNVVSRTSQTTDGSEVSVGELLYALGQCASEVLEEELEPAGTIPDSPTNPGAYLAPPAGMISLVRSEVVEVAEDNQANKKAAKPQSFC